MNEPYIIYYDVPENRDEFFLVLCNNLTMEQNR